MSGRRPIVAANWKMNTTIAEGLALVDALLPALSALSAVDRVVCPPFVSLAPLAERLRGTGIALGAQNVHQEPRGAFTGEVSVEMLKGLVQYVIIGHSERRQYFHETDALVHQKAAAVQNAGLTPIICVGESLEQHEAGATEEVVRAQTEAALRDLPAPDRVVLAYEPIWAIGTGRAATPEGANATIALIRESARLVLGAPGAALRIQYGGSVTAENFPGFIAQPEIDGALVGGASLKADQLTAIVRAAQAVA